MQSSNARQQVARDSRRVVSMIVPALLGGTIILQATPAWSRMQTSQPFRVLTGVIAYTDPKQGFAIIGDSVQNTFLVRPGQQLPDGAWIREIHAKDVVLEREGSLETLGMHERARSAGSAYTEMSRRPMPMPQQARWQEEALRRSIEAGMRPNLGRAAPDAPPVVSPAPVSAETPRSETPANGAQPNVVAPTETAPGDAAAPKQAQPRAPAPEGQEPADEFGGDARRQKADSGGR